MIVASGTSAFNGKWNVPKLRKVVYFNGEKGEKVIQNYLKLLMAARKIDDDYLVVYLSKANIYFDITTATGQTEFDRIMNKASSDIAVIDRLSSFACGTPVYKPKHFKPIADWLVKQRKAGRTIGIMTSITNKKHECWNIFDHILSINKPK